MIQQRFPIAAITLHTPHYEQVPFEVPEGWAWTTLGDLLNMQAGKNISANEIQSKKNEQTPYACYGGNGIRGFVTDYNTTGKHAIIGRQGALCGNINVAEGCFYATEHAVVVDVFGGTDIDWCIYMLEQLNLNQYATATAQPGLSVNKITEVLVPVPPQAEQKRISQVIQKWLNTLALIEDNKTTLNAAIINAKSKILDLAIHGKLVPQDPADEAAIELLQRINPKFTPCDNGQYEQIPQGWCSATLGDIGKWQSGATPSRLRKDYYGGNIPWLKTGDLNDGLITEIPEFITDKALEETSVKLNPTGSVLMAMYGATIGKVGILSFPATTNQACCACANYVISQQYLFYYLLAKRKYFIAQGGGGAQPNISKEKIISTPFPCPPALEQQRIVARIEELFATLDKIQNSLEA